jgi:hypothetical protein
MKKKLPIKWFIRVDEDSQPNIIFEWRKTCKKVGSNWKNRGYIGFNGVHHLNPPVGHIEITLEEFRAFVLKEIPPSYKYLINFLNKLNIK